MRSRFSNCFTPTLTEYLSTTGYFDYPAQKGEFECEIVLRLENADDDNNGARTKDGRYPGITFSSSACLGCCGPIPSLLAPPRPRRCLAHLKQTVFSFAHNNSLCGRASEANLAGRRQWAREQNLHKIIGASAFCNFDSTFVFGW